MQNNNIYEIFKYLSNDINQKILYELSNNKQIESKLENELNEIRIRVNQNIIFKFSNIDYISNIKVCQRDILNILEKICDSSIYAYKNQICNGFITIKGGNRVGITGTAVIDENGQVINIKNITSLNFRIARQVIGCSNQIINQVLDFNNNTIHNTLIVSPPGKGKTTMLRDLIRQISNGIDGYITGMTCGVVDERGEIAAIYQGEPQNDIGLRTDVIENIPKEKGIKMLIRSMGPQVIACDEIGTKEDIKAIGEALCSGVKGIFTMHGTSMKDIKNNKEINELVDRKQIEKIIFL